MKRTLKKQRLKPGRRQLFPSEVTEVFNGPRVNPPPHHSAILLLLCTRTPKINPPYALPLSSTLPDMKSGAVYYIELQKLYKKHAEEEEEILKSYMKILGIKDDFVDLFIKEFAWNRNVKREAVGLYWMSNLKLWLDMSYFFVSTTPTYSHKLSAAAIETSSSWLPSCLECLCLAIEENNSRVLPSR